MRTSIWFLMTAAAALALGSSLTQAEIIPIGAHFTGQLTGSIVGDSVQITANGSTVSEHGPVIAQATWSPSLIKVMQFVTGQIARLTSTTAHLPSCKESVGRISRDTVRKSPK